MHSFIHWYSCCSLWGTGHPRNASFYFSFLILWTVGRTPWTSDQPVARPLPAHDNKTQNKRRQTPMPRVGFESTTPMFEKAKTVKVMPLPGLELRPLDRPARSQRLHRLRYPGSSTYIIQTQLYTEIFHEHWRNSFPSVTVLTVQTNEIIFKHSPLFFWKCNQSCLLLNILRKHLLYRKCSSDAFFQSHLSIQMTL
jgi:hypothetical protein